MVGKLLCRVDWTTSDGYFEIFQPASKTDLLSRTVFGRSTTDGLLLGLSKSCNYLFDDVIEFYSVVSPLQTIKSLFGELHPDSFDRFLSDLRFKIVDARQPTTTI